MCGIAGILNLRGPLSEQHRTDTIRRMTRLLSHRGPDGEGYHAEGPVALGNRRLSIIDLEGGAQPMVSASGQVWITFNGEIYNYRELRKGLESRGHIFLTHSDTEVLLASYLEYGGDFLTHLNGMFALAIWDHRRQHLLLARDRLGIKPLYYAVTPDQCLVFGSEPKSLRAYPGVEGRLDLEGVVSYLEIRYPVDELSLYQGIKQLQPGCLLEVKGSQITQRRWWDVPLPTKDGGHSEDEYLSELRELVTSAIEYRMIADVPISCFISGGLDSTIIAGVMAQRHPEPVMTFTTGFLGDRGNEFSFAELAAREFHTDHQRVELDEEGYLEATRRLIWYKDGPLTVPHETAIYLMSQEIAKRAKVVLSGEGADELFGGYGRIMRSAFDYDRLLMSRNGAAAADNGLDDASWQQMCQTLDSRYKNQRFDSLADFFIHHYSYFPMEVAGGLLTDEVRETLLHSRARQHIANLFQQVSSADSVDQFMWVFEKMHLQALLTRLDTATMAASVEARGPFLDHRIVEFAMRLPSEYKMRWRSAEAQRQGWTMLGAEISDNLDIPKYLLRRAFQDLVPQEIAWRPKEAFSVPLEQLDGQKYSRVIQEVLLDPGAHSHGIINQHAVEELFRRNLASQNRRTAQALWMLANVEMWLEGSRTGMQVES